MDQVTESMPAPFCTNLNDQQWIGKVPQDSTMAALLLPGLPTNPGAGAAGPAEETVPCSNAQRK